MYKRIKRDAFEQQDLDQFTVSTNNTYTFDVVKINNLEMEGISKSKQADQVLKFMNKFKKYNLTYVPNIMINKRYKGVISNWFSIEHHQNHDFLQYRVVTNKKKKSLNESSALFLTIERPDGRYARVRTSTQELIRHLERENKFRYPKYDFKFYFVPKGYFQNDGMYIFAFEMRVYHEQKNGRAYYFIAENLFVEYSEHGIEDLLDENKGQTILDMRDPMSISYLKTEKSSDAT